MPLSTLPGVRAELQDGGLRPQSQPVQPKVTVIGCTNNPEITAGVPVRIASDDDAILFDNKYAIGGVNLDALGPVSKPSELSKAIAEAFAGGADHVEAIAITDPTGLNKLEVDPTPQRRFDGLEELYNDIKHSQLDIVVPVTTVIDSTGLASTDNFAYQLANLCHQTLINERACLGVIGVSPPVAGDNVPTLAETEDWVTALVSFDTSSLLGVDFTIGDGVTDDSNDGYADTYAFYATKDEALPIGTPPVFDADVEKDGKGIPVDIGRYLSVCANTERFINEQSSRVNPTLGYYHSNIASAYAGLIASIVPWEGTTNNILKGVTPVRPLSPNQAARLEAKRFVTLVDRPSGYKVANGVTWAHRISDFVRSDYTQLTTLRIATTAIDFVRTVASKYIGKPSNAFVISALRNDIDEALARLQTLGALNDYKFDLVLTPAQLVLGNITIKLTLYPALEIRKITVVAGVSAKV